MSHHFNPPKKRGRPRKQLTFREYLETTATKTSQGLVADIDDLTRDIFKHMDNPERISYIVLELALKNVGLGNYLIEALDEERALDSTYKWTVDKAKLDLMAQHDLSATAAESQAKVDALTVLEALNVGKKSVDILKIKRSDTEKVIDAARSRLALIRQDIRQS